MNHVTLLQQQLGQKCAVLAGYAGDQGDLGVTVHSIALRHTPKIPCPTIRPHRFDGATNRHRTRHVSYKPEVGKVVCGIHGIRRGASLSAPDRLITLVAPFTDRGMASGDPPAIRSKSALWHRFLLRSTRSG